MFSSSAGPLNIKKTQSFETSATTQPLTKRHFPEHLNKIYNIYMKNVWTKRTLKKQDKLAPCFVSARNKHQHVRDIRNVKGFVFASVCSCPYGVPERFNVTELNVS
jgi:hypothetical protein